MVAEEKLTLQLLAERIRYLEALMNERWNSHSTVHAELAVARDEAKESMGAKIAGLNNLRQEVRDIYDKRHDELLAQVNLLKQLTVEREVYEKRHDEVVRRITLMEKDAVTSLTLESKEKAWDIRQRSAERLMYMMLGGLIVIQVILKFVKIP